MVRALTSVSRVQLAIGKNKAGLEIENNKTNKEEFIKEFAPKHDLPTFCVQASFSWVSQFRALVVIRGCCMSYMSQKNVGTQHPGCLRSLVLTHGRHKSFLSDLGFLVSHQSL